MGVGAALGEYGNNEAVGVRRGFARYGHPLDFFYKSIEGVCHVCTIRLCICKHKRILSSHSF